jgi:hypothetical protein
MMPGALLLLVALGIVALLLGFSRWLARRPWAAAGNVVVGLTLLYVARALWPAAANLETYERLPSRNTVVAQVYCERTGPRQFRVTLTRLPDGRMQVYGLDGDEWRLEAKTLLWLAGAARIGLPSSYRWERLSARDLRPHRPVGAVDEAADTTLALTGYDLADADDVGEDVWAQARTGLRWASYVEPGRAYAPWRPLADGARYDVWLSRDPTALRARMDVTAANEAGAKAMR